jgi:hypothetical protein
MARDRVMKELSEALGIEHNQEILPPVKKQEVAVAPVPTEDQEDQKNDYVLARKTFRELIDKGNDAIEGIADLAKQSESPRAYEVMATLMKTVADTTKDLFDLQKRKKDLAGVTEKKLDESAITIDKAVFVGTTAELLRKVKSKDEDV